MRPFLAGCLLAFLILPGLAAAQIGNVTSGGLSIDVEPRMPGPHTEVTATVNDYTVDAFGAEINWYLDGALQSSAENERTFTFTTGKVGESTTLRLDLTKPDGTVLSASRTFAPARIDIIVEPNTFTPAFYRAAALPSIGSTVRFTALVFTGNTIDPEQLVYSWRFNGRALGTGGAVGRNQVEAEMPFTRNPSLVVSVSRRDGTLLGTKQMTVPIVDPKLVFYPVSTLNDMNRVAVSSPYQAGGDLTVRAQPYHISNDTVTGAGTVSWSLNNRSLNAGRNAYEVTINQGTAGRIQTEVKNPDNVIQYAEGGFTLRN